MFVSCSWRSHLDRKSASINIKYTLSVRGVVVVVVGRLRGKWKGSRIEEQVRVNCISSRFKLVPPERGGEPSMMGGKIDAGVWTKLHFLLG